MGNKSQSVLPASKNIDATKCGDLRFQHYNDGKIHIHDDKNGYKFEEKDGTKFQVIMDKFLDVAAIAPSGFYYYKGTGACSLSLWRLKSGEWAMELVLNAKGTRLDDEKLAFVQNFVNSY